MNNLYFEIVLPDYRDNPVAEIWLENNMVCEIIKESDIFEIVFFQDNYRFEINFDLFFSLVLEAKNELNKRFA